MGRDTEDDPQEATSFKSGLLPESIRKALATGLSAVFMTEEGIRQSLSDMRLPKDAVSFVLQQTERSRRELFRVVSDELKSFLKEVDLTGEARRALAGLKLQIKAEVRFVDADAPDAPEGLDHSFDIKTVSNRAEQETKTKRRTGRRRKKRTT